MRVTNTVVQLSTKEIYTAVCVCVFLLVAGGICPIKDDSLILHWICGFNTFKSPMQLVFKVCTENIKYICAPFGSTFCDKHDNSSKLIEKT